MGELQGYRRKIVHRFFTRIGREKSRLRKMERHTRGSVQLLGRPFRFHDNESFLATYQEIFEKEIYRFHPDTRKRTILDCGANIGLSVLYFSRRYPEHRILAFEPDAEAFALLQENVATYELNNVVLFPQAVWKERAELEFYTDHGLGGRVEHAYSAERAKRVQAVRLREYITSDVDFLKLDIEGSEYPVLMDCAEVLGRVGHIFFEYHGFSEGPQRLHELLQLLNRNGFHYYIKESSTRERPFVEEGLICELYDMAINIFAYPDQRIQNYS